MKKLINKYADFSDYTEDDQSRNIFFSIPEVDGDAVYAQAYPFQCKDYIVDVAMNRFFDFPFPIYGFHWDNDKVYHRDFTKLIMYVENWQEYENLKHNLPILHQYEKLAKLRLTTIEKIEPPENQKPYLSYPILITGSKMWSAYAPMNSLYTLFLRTLTYMEASSLNEIIEFLVEEEDTDGNIWDNIIKKYKFNIEIFLKNFREIFKESNRLGGIRMSGSTHMHNNSGILTFSSRAKSPGYYPEEDDTAVDKYKEFANA